MTALFHDHVHVVVLGSGSKGNATYIGDGRTGVLVDCGLSTKQILTRLEAVGLGDAPIDAVLITHEHSDHVGAAAILDRRLSKDRAEPLPFYMTSGTADALHPKVRPSRVEQVRAGASVRLGSWALESYTVPHDTLDPVAWAVTIGAIRVGVVTDLGRATPLVEQQLASLDVAVVEFNHDLEMLIDGAYPWQLKQRIRGSHGHLSNDQAGRLLTGALTRGDRLRQVVLGHLSEENNTPDKAWRAAADAVRHSGRRDVTLHLGTQSEPCGPLRVQAPIAPVAAAGARPRATPPSPDPAPTTQIGLFGK